MNELDATLLHFGLTVFCLGLVVGAGLVGLILGRGGIDQA